MKTPKKIKRNSTVDFLRGLAVIIMIVIHVTAYFLGRPLVRVIWDYLHFAVPLFVFCSAYITFQKRGAFIFSFSSVFKRVKRLYVPYGIFVIVQSALFYFVLGKSISSESIARQLMLGSGRDVGWLVVLFVYFIFLLPFVTFVMRRKSFWFLGFIPIASTLFYLYVDVKDFRFVMWLPWSAFLIAVFFFVRYEKKVWFAPSLILGSALFFFLSRNILVATNHTLTFTENKYPPNFYYLSYGVLMTSLSYYAHKALVKMRMWPASFQRVFDFFSTNSYSLFFIHFLFVYLIKGLVPLEVMGLWGFGALVVVLSVLTQWGINKATSALR